MKDENMEENCKKEEVIYIQYNFQHWRQSMWSGWLAVDMMVEDENVKENCQKDTILISFNIISSTGNRVCGRGGGASSFSSLRSDSSISRRGDY